MLIVGSSVLAAGCAPTFESRIDPPPQLAASRCETDRAAPPPLAPLDPRPLLPDARQSPCPAGAGLAACFTKDQEVLRQHRFKILHDDRDYCRDAYDRAVKRVAGE